jgi:competence protein ComEC
MTQEPLDLRLAPVALATWAACALALGWTVTEALTAAAVLMLAGGVLLRKPPTRHRDAARIAAATILVSAGAFGVAGLHVGAVATSPLAGLARDQAYVGMAAMVTSDPVRKEGQFAAYVVVRVQVRGVDIPGESIALRAPALVIGSEAWRHVHLGDAVTASGRLQAPRSPDLAGVLIARGSPTLTGRAGWVYRGIGAVRTGLVDAAAGLPAAERALVPALVDGDDSAMPAEVTDDFKTTGLTHLLAVSGSNLTLVLAFVLFVARWCGVRAVGLTATGLVTVVFFVLLARPEPSVLRAAAMGVVALLGQSSGGRRRGVRVLAVAITVLLLFDPWLSRSVGFLLSSLATAGILLLAPAWRDAMDRWMPRLLAEAVAVPLAAQAVCTPAIAAISGQVSVVAVLANLAAAPAVGPTTVLGLIAGLVAVVNTSVGEVLGRLAGLPATWIVLVATHGAGLAGASITWPVSPVAITGLAGLCVVALVGLHAILRRRAASLFLAALLVVAVLRPIGRLGWPPDGWLMIACDVGQGDGLVLNAGVGAAVVVDTGPDPRLMDRCLDRLHVSAVPLVVITHFHADHVDGLPGVLDGRRVGEIETSPLRDPPSGAEAVDAQAAAASVPITVAVAGERRTVGQLHWTVLAPLHVPTAQYGDSSGDGSAPNNASVVMLVKVQGVRLLLSGDAEPEEQADILATGVDLGVDVLKAAHHGSANQDPAYVFATAAALAIISVGAHNDYGHPASQTLGLLEQLGAKVYRTDRDGDVAVVKKAGQLTVVTSR